MKVTLDHIEHEAANILTFYFRPESKINYTAGQYIELTLEHKDVDDYGDKRYFTLSSSPADKLVSITSKFTALDGSSFKKALSNLKPGNILNMSEPIGSFILPENVQTPLIFVAGGIGITPFHSMLSWITARGEKRPIRLFYGVSTEKEIIFQPTFDKAGKPPTILVSNPLSSWKGQQGYLTAELILGGEKLTEDALIYISGPEMMVESLEKTLLDTGVKKQQLVLDLFLGGYRTV